MTSTFRWSGSKRLNGDSAPPPAYVNQRMTATTRIGAYGLVLRPGQILLCRIAPRVEKWAGWWTLPGGGIDFGEEPSAAMVREVEEETGLIVRPSGVAGLDSIVVPGGDTSTHSLRILYNTEIVGGELANEVDGSTDLCAWHDIEEVGGLRVVSLVKAALALL